MKPHSDRSRLTQAQQRAYDEERAYWLRQAGSHFDEAELCFIRWHQQRLLQALDLDPELSVTEVGCGAGKLLRNHPKVLLVDFSPEILARARRSHSHMEAVGASVDALPFRDRSLRCVVANNMLHHVKGEGLLEAAVAEFFRVLHPDGRLYVNDRNPTVLHHLIMLGSNLAKRVLRWGFGEFGGCGSFNEPLFLQRDWALIGSRFEPLRSESYYSVAMWGVDSLAKTLAVIGRRPRRFVDRQQQRALPWLLKLEKLPALLLIERTVVFRPRLQG